MLARAVRAMTYLGMQGQSASEGAQVGSLPIRCIGQRIRRNL